MSKRMMKKQIRRMRNILEKMYAPEITNNNHTTSIKWRWEQKAFDVVIVGQMHYPGVTHTKEFAVHLDEKPKTMGQLFSGSRWIKNC